MEKMKNTDKVPVMTCDDPFMGPIRWDFKFEDPLWFPDSLDHRRVESWAYGGHVKIHGTQGGVGVDQGGD